MTLSFVLLAYTGESVATTFVVTAGMFGAMAAYGTTTQRSLAGLGQFLFMGLIGVVLASIVGMFWHNDGLQFVISFIGVIVFTGLAAYDAQRLKAMALVDAGRPDRLVRDRRRARAVSRLHQPVPVPAALPRQPARDDPAGDGHMIRITDALSIDDAEIRRRFVPCLRPRRSERQQGIDRGSAALRHWPVVAPPGSRDGSWRWRGIGSTTAVCS